MISLDEYRRSLSLHRSYIMGAAIIWIMIHHSLFFGMYNFGYLEFFSKIGSCGVDIFLFVSAFGLYHSLSKQPDLRTFYVRRFVRIVPAFVVIMILLQLFTKPTSIVSPKYWFSCFMSNWYITFILFMYLLSPLIFKIQTKRLYFPFMISVFVSIGFTFLLVSTGRDNIHDVPMLMAQRLPVFTAGMLFADNRFNAKFSNLLTFILILVICVVLYFCYDNNMEYLVYPLFFFLGIGVTLLMSHLWIGRLDAFLTYTGRISLEIYLVHMAVIPFLVRYSAQFELPENCWGVFVVMCIITYSISILVNKVVLIIKPHINHFLISI